MNHSNDEKQLLTRREALKAFVAVTGATALSTLPGQWQTPVVEVGLLPAHAQASPTLPQVPTYPFGILCDPPPDVQTGLPASAKLNFTGDPPAEGTSMTLTFSPAILPAISTQVEFGQAAFEFIPPASSSGQTVELIISFSANSIQTVSGETVDVSDFDAGCGSITIA